MNFLEEFNASNGLDGVDVKNSLTRKINRNKLASVTDKEEFLKPVASHTQRDASLRVKICRIYAQLQLESLVVR